MLIFEILCQSNDNILCGKSLGVINVDQLKDFKAKVIPGMNVLVEVHILKLVRDAHQPRAHYCRTCLVCFTLKSYGLL